MLNWWNKWYEDLPAYKVAIGDPDEEIITPMASSAYGPRGIEPRAAATTGEFVRRTNNFRHAHELYLARLMEEVNAVEAVVARQDPDYQGQSE